ncbi:MAG: transcription factor TFIIIB subunit brf1 [Chaenotheca gracillima]|nr:MAG: transcription factor TFIIIB subunit brf1 [Chaenotheca gracillima]
MNALKWLQYAPLAPSTAVPISLSTSHLIEEEIGPRYNPIHYYPMRLGEVLQDRYQIATKLGWGTGSTVWLAQDLYQWRFFGPRYVAIKVNSNNDKDKQSAELELRINQHVSKKSPKHEGFQFVRKLHDSFDIKGPGGTHVCLVLEPLREPLWLLKKRMPGNFIASDLLKMMVEMLLQGLDYLQSECHVIHTGVQDLKLDNILIGLESKSILEDHARDEFRHPLPQKTANERTIYVSRNDFGPPKRGLGPPKIVDLGLAAWGDVLRPHNHSIQSEVYRAPEVILAAGWTYSADVWNLGVLLWDMLEGKSLFEELDAGESQYDSEEHLAHMTALLGPPPKELLDRGEKTNKYFSAECEFKRRDLIPKDLTLASTLRNVKGDDKRLFLEFVGRMLSWEPKDRSTAKELLKDPWLKAEFPESTD